MSFKPLEDIEGPIEIPFRGHTFVLPTLSWQEGLDLQQRIIDGARPSEIAQVLAGDVLDEIAKAGGSVSLIQRVAAVAIADFRFGRETAERVWEDPKVLMELNAAFNSAMRATETPSDEVATTPTRASGSGTRRKTPADHKPRSRGKSSSATGASS